MKRIAFAAGLVLWSASLVAEPIPGLDRYVVMTPEQDDVDLIEVLPLLFPGEFVIIKRYRTPSVTQHPAYMAVLTTTSLAQIVNERYGYLGIDVRVDKRRSRATVPPWMVNGGGALGGNYSDSGLWGQIRIQALSRPNAITAPTSAIARERGPRVCVIDRGANTGINVAGPGHNPGHPAIAGKALSGWNFAYEPHVSVSDVATGRVAVCKNQSDSPKCYQDDWEEPHGTHVSGIITGRDLGADAARGAVGVGPPNTQLLIARAFDNFYFWNEAIQDFEIYNTMFATDEAAALYWCAGANLNVPPTAADFDPSTPLIPVLGDTFRAQVVNMSFGGGEDPLEHNAIAYGAAKGIIFVASAGNQRYYNEPVDSLECPACYSEVIAVTALGPDEKIAPWAKRSSRAVAAPGVGIISSTHTDGNGSGAYESWDGTSMATPFVVGTIASMLAEMPYAGVDDIRFTYSESAGFNVINAELSCRR